MDWIECSDRLPSRKEFIGYVFLNGEIKNDVFFDRDKQIWFRNIMDWQEKVKNVSHWMPLPKPPEE